MTSATDVFDQCHDVLGQGHNLPVRSEILLNQGCNLPRSCCERVGCGPGPTSRGTEPFEKHLTASRRHYTVNTDSSSVIYVSFKEAYCANKITNGIKQVVN